MEWRNGIFKSLTSVAWQLMMVDISAQINASKFLTYRRITYLKWLLSRKVSEGKKLTKSFFLWPPNSTFNITLVLLTCYSGKTVGKILLPDTIAFGKNNMWFVNCICIKRKYKWLWVLDADVLLWDSVECSDSCNCVSLGSDYYGDVGSFGMWNF